MDAAILSALTDLIQSLGALLAPLLAGWLLPQPKFVKKDE